MVQAWYMDTSADDPRRPHRAEPSRAVGLEQLRRLGVHYWKVGGRRERRRAGPVAGPGPGGSVRAQRGDLVDAGSLRMRRAGPVGWGAGESSEGRGESVRGAGPAGPLLGRRGSGGAGVPPGCWRLSRNLGRGVRGLLGKDIRAPAAAPHRKGP